MENALNYVYNEINVFMYWRQEDEIRSRTNNEVYA